jgi:hypothetical protein
MNTLNYISISEAIKELSRIGQKEIVAKLENILKNNEVKKPELHNKKDDKTVSHFNIDLTKDELGIIKDTFFELEIESLTEDGEAGPLTQKYVTLLDSWSRITVKPASL